jgi:hypothetical protein
MNFSSTSISVQVRKQMGEERCSLSGRKSTLQEQRPEFKPQSHQKQNRKTEGMEDISATRCLYMLTLQL